jgi:uncharacterized membrane protein
MSNGNEYKFLYTFYLIFDILHNQCYVQIANEIEQSNYDCETFTCALTIPVSVILREHILYAYMSKQTNIDESIISVLRKKVQNVKDVWKLFMIPKLEQAVQKRADLSMPSPFLVEILLKHASDEVIFKEL